MSNAVKHYTTKFS